MNYMETIRELAAVAMPAGFEQPQAQLIEKLAKPYCDEITRDTLGNVICHRKGSGDRVMISAHMDVAGFMAMVHQKDGLIRFAQMGRIKPHELVNVRVITETGYVGVIRAEHREGKKLKDYKLSDLYLDLGVSTAEEARKLLPVGGVFRIQPWERQLAGDRFMTPCADNLAGVALVLDLMEQLKSSASDLYFVFSTREFEGETGAACAAYGIEPHRIINVDTVATGDELGRSDHFSVKLGGGIAIKVKEAQFLANRQVTLPMRDAAMACGCKWQMDIKADGLSDAHNLQRVRGGVFTGGLSIPARGKDTPCQVVDASDLEAGVKLMKQYLEG